MLSPKVQDGLNGEYNDSGFICACLGQPTSGRRRGGPLFAYDGVPRRNSCKLPTRGVAALAVTDRKKVGRTGRTHANQKAVPHQSLLAKHLYGPGM